VEHIRDNYKQGLRAGVLRLYALNWTWSSCRDFIDHQVFLETEGGRNRTVDWRIFRVGKPARRRGGDFPGRRCAEHSLQLLFARSGRLVYVAAFFRR